MLTEDEALNILTHAHNADGNLVAVDTETTGIARIKDGRDYLIGISIYYEIGEVGFGCYMPFRHNEKGNFDANRFRSHLDKLFKEQNLVWHNRKFDLHSLRTFGFTTFGGTQYDTLMEAQLVNEEWYSKELDYLGKMLLGEGKDTKLSDFAKIVGWANVPPGMMEGYAIQDTRITYKIHPILWKRLEAQGLVNLWPGESDFTTVLHSMEATGVGIDQDFAQRKIEYGTRTMDTIQLSLGFNPGSTNDLSKFFFDELNMPVLKRSVKTGKPSLTKDVLEEYDLLLAASNTTAARQVLEYRGWQKAVSSLYLPALELVSPDGRIRTSFKQHGTKTGRLSSSGPNLQQVPRNSTNVWNGDAKRLFNSGSDDYELIGWDYSQLEFRLATAYGRDQWLIDEFSHPEGDVFTAMSGRINAPRQTCKTFTYANLYGAGLEKIAYTLGQPPHEVEEMYNDFLTSIAGIKSASKVATSRAKSKGYVRYWNGRRRHIHNRDEDAHKAFNSLLQGGAAELVKATQLKMREIENEDLQMVLQVHDEIVFRIRKGTRDKYEPEIVERMTNWPDFGIPFTVEGKIWNNVEEMELVSV